MDKVRINPFEICVIKLNFNRIKKIKTKEVHRTDLGNF